ncbi:MAG: peptidoglycan DD-metalloendopeptidase family protein [Oleibacter sp.]|nr:peptidoglycan DD-metalloendopeptidase family protein [Thalassolituus sp.]
MIKTETIISRQKNNLFQKSMQILRWVTIVTLLSTIIGCASGGGFVSVDQKFSRSTKTSDFYRVKNGDTLIAIAWRYGLDYKALANANAISAPYTIYPGQKIDLRESSVRPVVVKTPPVKKPSNNPTSDQQTAQVPPQDMPKKAITYQMSQIDTWIWPLSGKVIGQFSTIKPVNKGIDIAASLGESVLAAADGTVVYAGTGLRGYGNLLIIRHNENYLSAYAHTNRILVSEDENVKAGDKIAETGSTGTDKVKLHFEIRKNGKPVNPLDYLPQGSR